MPRVQIKAQANYAFSTVLTVRTTDLNYGGHLGNDRLLSLIHEARVAFLAQHGWTELDSAGVGLIMGDTAVIYQGEAFAGDELMFEVGLGEPSACGFRLFYRVSRPVDNQDIALVENGMVCFNYTRRKIAPLPDNLRTLCLNP